MSAAAPAAVHPMVFLLDIDNTLLDNDRLQLDLGERLRQLLGAPARRRYFEIYEQLRQSLGYADYLGALQRYRLEVEDDPRVLQLSEWMLDYPFAQRLYPQALAFIARVRLWGPAVVLSDGDAVFQPHKVRRSGLWDATDGQVLIYVHKEQQLAQVERLYPAQHYVLVDDKLRVLDAVKRAWGERVTTVIPRQGHYATNPANDRLYAPADLDVSGIAELLTHTRADFSRAGPPATADSAATAAAVGNAATDVHREWEAQTMGVPLS